MKKFSPFGFTQIELAVALCIFGVVVMLPLQVLVGQKEKEKEENFDPLSEFEAIERVAYRRAYEKLSAYVAMTGGGRGVPEFKWKWEDGDRDWDSETPGLEFQILDNDHLYLLGAPINAIEEYQKIIERCETYPQIYIARRPPVDTLVNATGIYICVIVRAHRCMAQDDSRIPSSFDDFVAMAPLVFEFNFSVTGKGKGERYTFEELRDGFPPGSLGMLGHRMIWYPKAYSEHVPYENVDKGGVYVDPL